MADFNTAVNKVLKWEGGFQDKAADSGNYDAQGNLVGTNFGITAKTLMRVMNLPISYGGMQAMQKDYAKEVYRIGYWEEFRINEIQNQDIANIVLDTFVLFSWSTALALVNDAINITLNTNYQNIEPYILNNIANSGKTNEFVNTLVQLRIDYHNYRVSIKPNQVEFLKGWTNRANDYAMTIINKVKPFLYVGIGLGLAYFLFFKEDRRKKG